jgi:hypothetical protein
MQDLKRPSSPFDYEPTQNLPRLSRNNENKTSSKNIDELNKTYSSTFFETIVLNHHTVNLVAREIEKYVFFMVFEKCDALHKSKNLMYFHRIVTSENSEKLKDIFSDKKAFITLLPEKIQSVLKSKYCEDCNDERFVYLE